METPREPELPPPESTKAQSPTEQSGSIAPFCAYVVALLFGDLIGFAIMRVSSGPDEFLAATFASFIAGQIALASIVGGLMADNWLEGLFWSMVMVICGICLSSFGGGFPIDARSLRGMVALPFTCLIAALPLILLRWTIGWRLRRQDLPTQSRTRLTIEDMILVPASIAAICVLASGQDSSMRLYPWVSIQFLLLPILSLFFILPCTYWAFRLQDSVQRWLACMVYPLAVVIIAIIGIASLGGGFPGEVIGWAVFCTLVASFVAMLGTQILYSSGYRLIGFSRTATGLQPPTEVAGASPFDVDDSTSVRQTIDDPRIASSPRRHRMAVGILLAVTAIVNFGLAAFTQNEQRRYLENIVANGGTVKMENGKPVRIAFGPSTSDGTFYSMPFMPTVKSISLAGTQMKSLYLGNQFPSLESIDIRNTTIGAGSIGIPAMELVVSEGQFPDSDIKLLVNRGYSIKHSSE